MGWSWGCGVCTLGFTVWEPRWGLGSACTVRGAEVTVRPDRASSEAIDTRYRGTSHTLSCPLLCAVATLCRRLHSQAGPSLGRSSQKRRLCHRGLALLAPGNNISEQTQGASAKKAAGLTLATRAGCPLSCRVSK